MELDKLRLDIKRALNDKPDETHLIIVAVAGHGITYEGRQTIVINTLNVKKGFYEQWKTEEEIRYLASRNSNQYWIGIYAACRELYNPERHTKLVSTEAYNNFKAGADEITAAKAEELLRQSEGLIDNQGKIIDQQLIDLFNSCK